MDVRLERLGARKRGTPCRRLVFRCFVLAAVCVASAPATAGLVYDWVSLDVVQAKTSLVDPSSVAGHIVLKDGVGTGELILAEDISVFYFRDPSNDDWTTARRLRAEAISEPTELGIGESRPISGARLKEAFFDLQQGLNATGTETSLRFTTAPSALQREGLPPAPTLPRGVDLWFWELTFRDVGTKEPVTLYSGQGLWALDASSLPVPEPATWTLIGAALMAMGLRRSRARR